MRPGRRASSVDRGQGGRHMHGRLLGGVGVALSLWASTARAEEVAWRPVASTPRAAVAPAETPAATLGRPVPLSRAAATADPSVTLVTFTTPPPATLGPI